MSFFEGTSSLRWYALKVFYRRYAAICATLNRDGVEYFIPPLRPDCMLMFVRTTSDYIAFLQTVLLEKGRVVCEPRAQRPAYVSDAEIEMFRLVTSMGANEFEVVDNLSSDRLKDYCRVIEGKWKGAEGFLARIRHRKRLVVTLGNFITVAATDYIPIAHLERISLPLWKQGA